MAYSKSTDFYSYLIPKVKKIATAPASGGEFRIKVEKACW
jgi:hypothetical protein